jgi:phenylpropionate dioxygenase-like ring-hydroxylating dioxygenase large terminal subunit
MTTPAENELLTQIGPGTLMGTLLRQYWVPACLSSELIADGDPLRLMLLGEKLIAFRDSTGRIGILDHRCPHRCASLFFGRNEEGGLRCVYHGWKFDIEGNCLDMPNLPDGEDVRGKVKAHAYPAAERGGLAYVYMGERAVAPPLPAFEALLCPPEETLVTCRQRECNWVQALEGDLDPSHFSFLHTGAVKVEDIDPNHIERFQVMYRAPRYQVEQTDWGLMFASYRPADPSHTYYRYTQFAMPFWTMFPNGPLFDNILAQAWVPMDDTHTMTFTALWKKKTPPLEFTKHGTRIPGIDRLCETLPNTADWFGRWRLTANQDNDYLIDRDSQRADSFTGIWGVAPQDAAVTESMGEVSDRTLEHLVPSDQMIVLTRRRLVAAALALRDHGTVPPLVDDPEAAATARAGDLICPESQSWLEGYGTTLGEAIRPTLKYAAE